MTTHVTLKTDIASYLARSDLTDSIPTFVRLAEAMIRDDVRVRAMETATTITISAQTVALPDGFMAARRLYLDVDGEHEIQLVSPDMFWADGRSSLDGNPEIYAIEGDSFVFAPVPSSDVYGKLLYTKAFTALSGDADTNWLLTNHYDVYLYAALSQAKAFIEDDDQAGKWANAYKLAVDKLNEANWKSRYSGGKMRVGGCPV